METILAEWESFAGTRLPAASTMTPLALRDHAQQILEAVAKDLRTFQSREAQIDKSLGRGPGAVSAPETAAQTHAVLRARSGFNIEQLAAEYRALRASVLRLWMDAFEPEASHLDDVIRFNEAIDQALAESIAFFSAQVHHTRSLVMGMLGHDMRTPLQIILLAAKQLEMLNAGAEVSQAAGLLTSSSLRIKALVEDLLEVNRLKLGVGIRISASPVQLATLFADHLHQLRAVYPENRLDLEVTGDTRGRFDGLRLQRLLDNLVVNAIKYGDPGAAVSIVLAGEPAEVRFEVHNQGPAIEQSELDDIFEPLKRGPDHENQRADGSLGLGLYIAREIAGAHGGNIAVRSDKNETVFTVSVPRRVGSEE